jgi:hypothetical protein
MEFYESLSLGHCISHICFSVSLVMCHGNVREVSPYLQCFLSARRIDNKLGFPNTLWKVVGFFSPIGLCVSVERSSLPTVLYNLWNYLVILLLLPLFTNSGNRGKNCWYNVCVYCSAKRFLLFLFCSGNFKPKCDTETRSGLPLWCLLHLFDFSQIGYQVTKLKVITIPLQARRSPEGSKRLRLPDFKTIGTWRW